MPLNNEGVNIIITGDASQAIKEIQRTKQATDALKDQTIEVKVDGKVDDLGRLHKANGQFMTMGEKLAAQFSSGFMKKAAELSVKIDGWGKTLETSFGTAFKTITGMASSVARVLGFITKSALAVGGGFEAQMTTVKVISGATEEELDTLTAKAREMGASLPISAKQSAEAMTVLAQRGTSVKDILASVSDVANLAISQAVDMRTAADLLGSTITNFRLAMEDASKVTAIFNNASNQSALNMPKLVEAMKYVGPTAGALGMELTEAIAALEALANTGLSAEMSGTGFAMVLTKLASKSRIMGVETKDMQGHLRPLADIFSELQAKGFSLAEATAEFGARGRLAALGLAELSTSLKPSEERLKQWGSTQAAVDEKAKTFTNTMAAFRSAVEEFHIEVFTQIKEQSKEAVSSVTSLVRVFAEWIGKTQIAGKTLLAFLDGLGFNIPTGADFKKLLEQIDIQAFVDRAKAFAVTIKSIANSIVSFADLVKSPILFLIEHLNTFATISFWSWILGKGLQIPAAIMSIATAFKALSAINLSSVLALLSSPVLWGAAGIAALGTFMYQRIHELQEAKQALHVAEQEEMRYLREQANANNSIDFDIHFNMKTGFEKLPESWTKASDELREKANSDVQAIRDAFRDNVAKAIQDVTAKFPDMADAFKNASDLMTNSSLSQITKALQGNQQAFDALPEHIKKVVEQLYYMDVRAGQVTGSIGEILIAYKKLQSQISSSSSGVQDNSLLFLQDISASVNSLLAEIPDNIDKFQKFLTANDLQLGVSLSLDLAHKQIDELAKSIAQKFNIPTEIVSSAFFSKLRTLAEQGNKTASSITNSWKGPTTSIDAFLTAAQEAISYLNMSPDKFLPALKSLANNIQKVDPLTGKLTEQFKKAYDALKQWSNITFDQLAQRIQRLRKAVEGGFIDKSALEAEFSRVAQQVKLQVVTELQPSRESYQSESAFRSVVASEYVTRMGELGGQAFMNLLQKEFSSLYYKSGSAIGAAILRQVDKGLSSNSPSIKINGTEILGQNSQSQGIFDYRNISKAFSDSLNPFIAKLEQLNSKQLSSGNDIVSRFPEIVSAINKLSNGLDNNSSVIGRANEAVTSLINSIGNIKPSDATNSYAKDYSAEFSSVVKEIQSVSDGISSLQGIFQDNINAINGVISAVNSLEATFKTQQDFAPPLDTEALSSAISNSINPLVSNWNTNSSLYQEATSELAHNMLSLQNSVEALKNSVDTSSNSLSSWQNSVTSNNSSTQDNFSVALNPLINATQALYAIASNIQSTHQGNAVAIANISNAIKAVLSAIKSLDTGNNYNIDIHQEGFIIQKRNDATLLANDTVNALRLGFGNGGV